METTATLKNNNELQVKENWSKPEINLIGINEDTLGGVIVGLDGSNLS